MRGRTNEVTEYRQPKTRGLIVKKYYPFNKALIGCHIDGACGEEHRRQKLVAMLDDCLSLRLGGKIDEELTDVRGWLQEAPSDDYGEEDSAIELLGAFTSPGLVWVMESGDLILTTEEQATA